MRVAFFPLLTSLAYFHCSFGLYQRVNIDADNFEALSDVDTSAFGNKILCDLACSTLYREECTTYSFDSNNLTRPCHPGKIIGNASTTASSDSVAALINMKIYQFETAYNLVMISHTHPSSHFCLDGPCNSNLVVPSWPEPGVEVKLFAAWNDGIVSCGGRIGTGDTGVKTCFYAQSGDDRWTGLPSTIHIHTHGVLTALKDGRLWISGGSSGDYVNMHSKTEFFDGQSWTSGPDLKQPVGFHSVVQTSEKTLVTIGGSLMDDDSTQVWRLNLKTNYWTKLQDMPIKMREQSCGLTKINEVEHIICNGGTNYYVNNPPAFGYYDYVFKYDIQADIWTQLNAFPHPFQGTSLSIGINQKYFSYWTISGLLLEYDKGSDSWTEKALPNPGIPIILETRALAKI